MSVVEFRKGLSEHVLPGALHKGVGRQRGSWKASMSRHALSCALQCGLPRQRFAGCFGLCTLHCVHRIKAVLRTGQVFRALRCALRPIRTPDRGFRKRVFDKVRIFCNFVNYF